MTADPRRRRRASRLAVAVLASGVVLVAVLAVVAGLTLRSSEEGTDITPPEQPAQQFPPTPIGVLGVIADGRLSSLVVAVLDPSGTGGSVVTVPVNLDTTAGFGDERSPLARRAYEVGDPSPLVDELTPVIGIEPSFVEVVDADRLRALLGDPGDVVVTAVEDVVDVSDGSPDVVIEAGDRRVDVDIVIDALLSVPADDRPAYEVHRSDVAVWEGLADAWSATIVALDVPTDDVGAPIDPPSLDELMSRLRAGRVSVRDLAIDRTAAITLDNPTGADFVALDTRDTRLVFASIAPERVLTPGATLTFSIVAPFDRAQLAANGDVGTSALVRELIGELAFLGADVVWVDATPAEGGAPAETVVVVDDEDFVENGSIPPLIGPSQSRIAARDTDGSDVILELGTDFLEHRADLRAEAAAERDVDDGAADFDVSGGDESRSSGDPPDDDADQPSPDTTGSDTVESDE
ncbi:MAG: hypothetical protein AAGG08_08955 [Actinomycetota bacterium]